MSVFSISWGEEKYSSGFDLLDRRGFLYLTEV